MPSVVILFKGSNRYLYKHLNICVKGRNWFFNGLVYTHTHTHTHTHKYTHTHANTHTHTHTHTHIHWLATSYRWLYFRPLMVMVIVELCMSIPDLLTLNFIYGHVEHQKPKSCPLLLLHSSYWISTKCGMLLEHAGLIKFIPIFVSQKYTVKITCALEISLRNRTNKQGSRLTQKWKYLRTKNEK